MPSGSLDRLRGGAGRLLRRLGLPDGSAEELPPVRTRPEHDAGGPVPDSMFVNPIAEGADPFVVRDGDGYLWCHTVGDAGVAVRRSDRLTSLGQPRVVWRSPAAGPYSREVWAPELIRLDGRWHIYVAASDGRNENHLAYVLVADTPDPQGSYTLHGPLATGDGDAETGNAWAIDMTVLEHAGRRYAVWSGWPDAATPVQHLYIAEMASPTELAGPRVQLTSPFDHPWERIRDDAPEAINEAPQPLVHDGRTFLVYSCGSALLPSYKLGLLELVGDDPLDPTAWHKRPTPLFTSTQATFGVGHASFVPSPDGSQWWVAYHAKISRERSFKRVIHVQPFTWSAEGEPALGEPVPAGVAVPEPSGTPHRRRSDAASWTFAGDPDAWNDFDYYGHQQFIALQSDGLHLGRVPDRPVNAFRSGEKVVLRDAEYADVRVRTSVRIVDAQRAVGVLLRVTGPAVGFDAQRGYFAGWVPRAGRLVLGRTDGSGWEELGRGRVAAVPGSSFVLVAEAVGDRLSVHLEHEPESRVEVRDERCARGSLGLRVVGSHAVFVDLSVTPLGG